MKPQTELSAQELYQKKERFYPRNFISLMFEGFTFSFALAMFSPENVLPVYVASLSDKAIYIALISALYYGFSYGCTVFSCVLGVNAKSPKWISVIVCFLQRVGFFTIFLSTFLVGGNTQIALVLFFVSFAIYSASAGMSNPLFAQMVGTSIATWARSTALTTWWALWPVWWRPCFSRAAWNSLNFRSASALCF